MRSILVVATSTIDNEKSYETLTQNNQNNSKTISQKISAYPELYCKNHKKNFRRKRKLPLEQIIKSVLSMSEKSLFNELIEYFNLKISMPTVSTLVQKEAK